MRQIIIASLSFIFLSSTAMACLPNSEMFMVSEYEGQENPLIGRLNLKTGEVEVSRNGFVISSVVVGGEVICSEDTVKCGADSVQIGRAIHAHDQVEVIYKETWLQKPSSMVFLRTAPAKTYGSICPVIFGTEKRQEN